MSESSMMEKPLSQATPSMDSIVEQALPHLPEELSVSSTQKRAREQPSPVIQDSSPPSKKLKPNVGANQNLSTAASGENLVKTLSERKMELEMKLKEVTEHLAMINETIENRSKEPPPPPLKQKKAPAPKKKSTRVAPKKATPTTPDSRPKRQRTKSAALRDADEPSVTLPPALESCKGVLNAIARHRCASPFMVPVDPVLLNIPDYFSVITHPMDFGTIKTKLLSGQYEDIPDLVADANLVFSNACTYNPSGSYVHTMAETLREFFAKKIKVVEDRERRRKLKDVGEIQDLRQSVNTIKDGINQIMDTKKPQPTTVKIPSEVLPMSKADMRKLSVAVNSLGYNHLATIITIIQDSMPSLAGEEEIEIDLNTLDNVTLRRLEAFVSTVTNPKKSRKKSSTSAESRQELARRSREGTEKEIDAVQRRIEELRDPLQPPRVSAPPVVTEEPIVKVDESESSGSESESGSSSESESESESDSDDNQ